MGPRRSQETTGWSNTYMGSQSNSGPRYEREIVSGARIGLIVPSSNTSVESEFYRMIPRGFTIHSARMGITEVTLSGLTRMERDARAAALLLRDAKVEIICYACTSGSFYRG